MTDLTPLPKIQDFIQRHKIVAQKLNEREWGSYEIAMYFDGSAYLTHQNTFVTNRVWGAAIPVSIAIQDILLYYGNEAPNTGQFSHWLGEERVKELQELMKPTVDVTV